MRKAECRGCGYVIRLTREWIARGLPVCPCGEQMECRCLEDRMIAGDVSAHRLHAGLARPADRDA